MRRVGKKQLLAGVLSAAMVLGSTVPAFAAEWKRDTVGWWWQEDNGQYPTNTWRFINNNWFYFYESGYMATGWVWEGNRWYFTNSDGVMLTGWVMVDGKGYYLNPISDGTKGAMLTGTIEIDGSTYTFDASGACVTGYPKPGIAYAGNGTKLTDTGVQIRGGGASSTSTPSSETLKQEVNANLTTMIQEAESNGDVGEDKQIVSITHKNTTIEVKITEDPELRETTVEEEGTILEIADTIVDSTQAKTVQVQGGKVMTVDEAKQALEEQLGYRTLESLSPRYTVTLNTGMDNEVTYHVTINK